MNQPGWGGNENGFFRIGLCLVLMAWALLLATLFWRDISEMREANLSLARNVAGAYFNKDYAFRLWAASHGGVYVPISERTPPNPNLAHVPERDIQTPSGKRLTLINPAYMVRQLQEDFEKLFGVRGHITGLKHFRSETAPDDWEKDALRGFEAGNNEAQEFTNIDGKPYLRLMRPLIADKSCLKCHAHQGYKEGDVRGGVAVALPMKDFLAVEKRNALGQVFSYGVVLVVGSFVIMVGFIRLRRREEERDSALADLGQARDELNIQVQERTKELNSEKNLISTTLRSIGDGVITTDIDGRITALNREAEKLTGWSEEEALGRPLEQVFVIVDERTREPRENPVRKALETGEIVELANCTALIARDGSEIIVEDTAAPIRAEGAQTLGVVLVFRDITERAKAEEELKKSEALLKEAQQVGRLGHWELDDPAGTPTWSEEIFRIFGLDPARGEPSFAAHQDIIHKGDWELLNRAVESLSAKGISFDIEFRFTKPDGSFGWINAKGYPRKNQQGEIVRLFGTAQDITDRKRAEMGLKDQLSFIGSLIEAIPAPIFYKDIDHVYLGCNQTFAEFVGRSKEDIIGKSVFEVAPTDLAEVYRAQDAALFNNPSSQVYESLVESRDGSKRDVIFHKAVFRDASGAVAGLIGAILDITERKKAEEERENLRRQLSQAQKMEALGTLTGGIAHDFNNLLTIINGYTELMLTEMTEDDPLYPDLQKIFETGQKGADLVRRLLALSREGKGNPKPLNLNEVVEQSVAPMKRTFPKMIEIDTSLDKELSMVNADASQIEQVLMNICVNAKDAMPNGGRIGISTKNIQVDGEHQRERLEAKTGPHVLMEISDTGSGISAEIIERVFEPFFTTKGWDFRKGTGLGLPVAKGIVEQHGGWIACRSEEGTGTTFSVYLPSIGEESDLSEQKIEEPSPTGKKILLVDDEEFVRDLGRRILERSDQSVVTASSCKEALEIYAREGEDIGLVILDLMMPQMGGEECLYELVRMNPAVKVIISTGHHVSHPERQSLSKVVKRFVNKPFGVEHLKEAVRAVLEGN